MEQIRRYTFDDLVFDDGNEAGRKVELAELEAVRQSARAEGHAAGLAEARAETEAALARALGAVADAAGTLLAAEAARTQAAGRDAVSLAMTALSRLLPEAARRHALAEIEAVLTRVLAERPDEPRLVVRVAEDQFDAVRARIEALAAERGFAGRLVFLAEPGLKPADARIEWADGGAERAFDRMWNEIERAAAEALAPAPTSSAKGD